MPLAPRSRGFAVFLACLSSLPPLATDMALPGIDSIQSDLGATQAQAAAIFAIFLVGFSTAPIPVGPLTDRLGRKPVVLAGLGVFALASVACALAPSIGALLIFRLLQGFGAGAAGILPRAIIRDSFEGREARVLITTVTFILGVAPAIAPTLGAGVLAVASWRAIFWAFGAFGVAMALAAALGFAESLPRHKRQSLAPAQVAANYRRALTNPQCLGFALVNGLGFAGLFAYINVSPLLFIEGYGVSKAGFAALFALTASGIMLGSLANGWLLRRGVTPIGALDLALGLCAAVAVALLAASLIGAPPAILVAGLIVFYVIGYGLCSPNASHEAMAPMHDIAGFASAIMLSGQMILGALGGALGAAVTKGASPLGIAEIMVVCMAMSGALYAVWLRPRVAA